MTNKLHHREPEPPRKDGHSPVCPGPSRDVVKSSGNAVTLASGVRSARRWGVGQSVSESMGDKEGRGALFSLKGSGDLDTLLPSPLLSSIPRLRITVPKRLP